MKNEKDVRCAKPSIKVRKLVPPFRSSCALWACAASWLVVLLRRRCRLLPWWVWKAEGQTCGSASCPSEAAGWKHGTAHSPPLLLAWLLLSVLALLLLAAAASPPLLLLLGGQVLVRVVVDKLVHVASFLALSGTKTEEGALMRAASLQSGPCLGAGTHSSSSSSLLLLFGRLLGSLCEGEQVLGLLHVQSSLLQQLLLLLHLSVPLLLLIRFEGDKNFIQKNKPGVEIHLKSSVVL